jgi:hypothetical protein
MLKRHAADRMPGFEVLEESELPELEDVVGQLITDGHLDKQGGTDRERGAASI